MWHALVTIGDRRYIDGGVRSTINADLAAGHDSVAVLSPFTVGLAGDVSGECDELARRGRPRCRGHRRRLSVAAFGTNPLDPTTRRPSAEAGRAQAAAVLRDEARRGVGVTSPNEAADARSG